MSKLNIELKKKLVRGYIWSIAFMAQRPGQQENWNGSIWKASGYVTEGEWKR